MWKIGSFLITVKKIVTTHIVKILFVLLIPVLIYSQNILSYVNTQLTEMKAIKMKEVQMKEAQMKEAQHKKPVKIVVFDLDETIGYFTEISIFWDALEHYYGHNLLNDKFFEMLDVFPEFFRPDIMKILDLLHKKKSCYKMYIYTNNQGPKSWVNMLSEYMDSKLGYKIFDYIIAAYKIRGKQIELKRTSHEKSVTDLISCTDVPKNTEICFIDDLYHPLMDKDNVYYINIKPYRVSIPFEEMASRYYAAVLSRNNAIKKSDFVNHIVAVMKEYNYMVLSKSAEEKSVDTIVSKKLLANLEEFLKNDRISNTRKRRYRRVKSMRQNNK
jgi:hypothetical protein